MQCVRFGVVLGVISCFASAQVYQASPGSNAITSNQYNNQYSNQANSSQYNNQYNANQNSQNQISRIPNDNIFLEYYPKQGDDFSCSVYYNESGNLTKRDISVDDLQKTVVIFSGNWCPYCHNFINSFAKYIKDLNARGIKVVIVDVPSVDKLRDSNPPTIDDYNESKSRLEESGIRFSANTKLAIIGESAALARNGIEGLPVVIAVKTGREYFRGVGQTGVSKLNLSDQNVLKQFLEIWDEVLEKTDSKDSDQEAISGDRIKTQPKKKAASKSTKSKKKVNNKQKRKAVEKKPKSDVDINASHNATELLNNMNFPTAITTTAQPNAAHHALPHCHCSAKY